MAGERLAAVGLCVVLLCAAAACDGDGGGPGEGGSGVFESSPGTGASGGSGSGGGGGGGGTVLTLDTARPLAVRLSACTGSSFDDLLFALGVAYTRADAVIDVPAAVRCVVQAADCPTVLRCLGYRPDAGCQADAVCADDRTLRVCAELDNGLEVALDVACTGDQTGGPTCVAGEWDATCGVGTCGEEEEGATACEGDTLLLCDGGVRERWDCGRYGLVCGEIERSEWGGPAATCLPDEGAAPCGDSRCEGSTLVICGDLQGTALARIDCARVDPALTCVARGGEAGCGVPEGSEQCDGGDMACDGAAAVYCLGGYPVTLDCGGFLGGACHLDEDDEARCEVPGWPAAVR